LEKIVQNWVLSGAFGLAFAMGLASFLAGVSFYQIVVRMLVGTSAFLIVGGILGGIMSRSLLLRGSGTGSEEGRAEAERQNDETHDKAA
jgi:hypothetical protein